MARTAVVAGTATAVSNRVSRRQAERWADQGQDYRPREVPYAYAEEQQQQQAYDLKAQGILTEEEFAAQKAQILGS
jgi:hypothetical protein